MVPRKNNSMDAMSRRYWPADAVPLERVRRALVIKLRHHGDVLLASPVLSVLKNHAPQVEIDALVYADTAEMLSLHPALNRLFLIDRRWKNQGILAQVRHEYRLLKGVRERQYDLIIHLTEHWRGAWLTRLCEPRWSVAPAVRSRGRRWVRAFTHLARSANGRHVVESNLDALRRIGIQPMPEERNLTLIPGHDAEQNVDNLINELGLVAGNFVHVHPASRWQFKCWPVESMTELIGRLQDEGLSVVLTAAPDPDELAMVKAIQGRLATPVQSLVGRLSLKELAALTARARLFVGVDSAPMHIAAAVGTPVVALFGPSGYDLWGPWTQQCRIVARDDYGCRPCGLDGCGGGKISDCLVRLPVEQVWSACRELLG